MANLTKGSTQHLTAWRLAILLSLAALGPLVLAAPAVAKPPVACSALATYVKNNAGTDLNLHPIDPGGTGISSTTPVVAQVVAAGGGNLSYCQVVFQIEQAITIEVGLPLNTVDGGTGGVGGGCGVTSVTNNSCVTGNWNGKVEAIGNGGYAGLLPGVTSATNVGFVGSSTDNGHSTNWCNATNPQTHQPDAQPNCGNNPAGGVIGAQAEGGFELDTNNKLLPEQIRAFINRSEVEQTVWARQLAERYYGQKATRTYWNGCSTGGRQGMQMAQFHAEMFDGILAGAPAFNWNRFIPGNIWPPVVLADVDPADCTGGTAAGCNPGNPFLGSSTAFDNAQIAANAAAVAACDGDDGVLDGVINEPRHCAFDARTLIGQTPPPMTAPMTEAQAQAINMIWDGPRNQRGQRLWGGITRGTSFTTNVAYGLGLNAQFPLYWVYQNPNFNITANITTTNFANFFQEADRKFADTVPPPPGFVVPAATDSIDLTGLITSGTKLIHYRGSADPLIPPFGSWNWDSRLFEKYGVAKTQKFYRSFYFPGNGHCGGNAGFANAGLINSNDLFNALISWVENNNAPNSVVAYTGANDTGNTTLICPAPNRSVYNGGAVTSSGSYTCTNYQQEPPELAAYDETAKQYYEAP